MRRVEALSMIAGLYHTTQRLPFLATEPIFLNGQLTIDFPEDVKIPIEPNQMVTAQVVGSSIKFSYCGLDRAIALLREQYAVGTVEVKVLRSPA